MENVRELFQIMTRRFGFLDKTAVLPVAATSPLFKAIFFTKLIASTSLPSSK
ncbi:hypothetical protein J2Z45_000812 [Cohnella lubricantis]|nr:hypothetical protein [Cohnella lubricantis]